MNHVIDRTTLALHCNNRLLEAQVSVSVVTRILYTEKCWSAKWLTQLDFGQPCSCFAQKMADARLLFLALCMYLAYTENKNATLHTVKDVAILLYKTICTLNPQGCPHVQTFPHDMYIYV